MNELELPWIKILIGLIFIVLFLFLGRFMSKFKTRNGRLEFRDMKEQMTPRGFKALKAIIAIGFTLYILLRLYQAGR